MSLTLSREELGIRLRLSNSSIRRLEAQGMPVMQHPGMRKKVYDLAEVGRWIRKVNPQMVAALVPQESPRNYYGGNARAKMLGRMPTWADKKAIRAVYAEARRLTQETGIVHHVDHVIPLNGRDVSGLHVENNLQVLTDTENRRKHNHFEGIA